MKRLAALACAAALTASAAYADQVKTRKVSFKSDGETLSGMLYMPEDAGAGEKRPGIVVSGAWTSIKEQMSGT